MNTSSSTNPGFFGKDNVSFFIGQVEDINDPKRSSRVKVRCVGWHPKDKQGEGGVTTEDLPWARVGMPTTHAQQNKSGGKHGLLPGSWVVGFFLDGEEAQSPFVLNTFNFTADSTEDNNREDSESEEGKIPSDSDAFSKVNTNAQKNKGGKGVTTKEQDNRDKSGDQVLDDSDDQTPCEPLKPSVADEERKDKKKRGDKSEGQVYNVPIADGFCNSLTSGKDEIQNVISELFPPQSSRVAFGDIIFNSSTGSRMNMNGIMNLLSQLICGILKDAIQTKKGFLEDTLNRLKMGITIKVIPDRDGYIREMAAIAQSTADDFWNMAFNMMIDTLCSQVFGMLQGANNGESTGKDGDNNSSSDTNVNTQIQNENALCITEKILNDVDLLFIETALMANEQSEIYMQEAMDNINLFISQNGSMDIRNESSSDEISEELKKAKKESDDKYESTLDSSKSQDANEIFGLIGEVSSFLGLILNFKFTTNMLLFNKGGIGALAKQTMSMASGGGCKPTSMFSTAFGSMGSGGGVGNGITGGGSTSGKSSKENTKDLYPNMGFGGKVGVSINDPSNILCEEATTPEIELGYCGAQAKSASLPSSQSSAAINFNRGVPNVILITNPGDGCLNINIPEYNDSISPNQPGSSDNPNIIPGEPIVNDRCDLSFPSVYIQGYKGYPKPVVNRISGEVVSILTDPDKFDLNIPNPTVSIIPDDNNCNGIYTDDPDNNIIIIDIVVDNTGDNYEPGTPITIIDPDTGEENGSAELVIEDGRILDVVVTDGGNFTSFPIISINGNAILTPIMGVIPKIEHNRPDIKSKEMIFCPAKNQINSIRPGNLL